MPNDPSAEPSAELSSEQTVSGVARLRVSPADLTATPVEREVLRGLAGQVAELAARPIEAEKARLWTRHNDLTPERPMVFIDPENGWNEIITQDALACRSPLLRLWEMGLRKEIHWATVLRDDRVIEPYLDVPFSYTDTGWGLVETQIHTETPGGAYTWDYPLKDYDRDWAGLRYPEITIDWEGTRAMVDWAQSLFGDLLAVRLRQPWWWSLGMTWEFIRLRGLENLMLDMYDHPEGVHRLMAFLRDGNLRKLEWLGAQRLLALNNEGAYVGSGGFGWTTQLPQPDYDGQVRTMDMWGFTESQETVGVSPALFAEFIYPYQRAIAERFGLNCYGCCEPVDSRWHVIRDLPRLRRVSVSPWASVARMAEHLGQGCILSRKPSPTPLSMPIMDDEAVRASIREDLDAGREAVLEIIMKDNHTLGGNPRNASRWVELVREEIDRLAG